MFFYVFYSKINVFIIYGVWWCRQEESLATDDENSVVFDVSSQQNVWRDDSHSVSSTLTEVAI